MGVDDDSPPAETEPKRGGVPLIFVLIGLSFIAFVIIAIGAAIVIPNLVPARKPGNELSAIGALRRIQTAQAIFREGDKEHDGNLDYGTLSELSNTTLVDSVLGSGTQHGYCFEVAYSTTTSEFLWWGMARPEVPGATGDRAFYVNSEGVIVYTVSGPEETLPRPDPRTCALPKGATRIGR